jgi:prevent-host-death family protein
MKTIGAREANQNFSKIMREAEAGEVFVVTRNGVPSVRIEPIAVKTPGVAARMRALARSFKLADKLKIWSDRPITPAGKKKSIARMIRLMKSAKVKIDRPITRDEMHER